MANHDFIRKLNRLSKALDRMPHKAATVAVNFSKERFRQKNWVDRSRQKWPARKRPDRGSILVKTARLKRSIRKVQVTRNYIIIGTDVEYAQIHNDGGTVQKNVRVRAHTRKRKKGGTSQVKAHQRQMNTTVPPRQFIGESALLLRRVEKLVARELEKALQ